MDVETLASESTAEPFIYQYKTLGFSWTLISSKMFFCIVLACLVGSALSQGSKFFCLIFFHFIIVSTAGSSSFFGKPMPYH
jgi:hypothetical protein